MAWGTPGVACLPAGRAGRLPRMEKFSLDAVVRAQVKLAAAAASGRSAETVYGGHEHALRQTVLALTAGSSLDEHESPGEATVQVLRGRVRLTAGEVTWEGRSGDLSDGAGHPARPGGGRGLSCPADSQQGIAGRPSRGETATARCSRSRSGVRWASLPGLNPAVSYASRPVRHQGALSAAGTAVHLGDDPRRSRQVDTEVRRLPQAILFGARRTGRSHRSPHAPSLQVGGGLSES